MPDIWEWLLSVSVVVIYISPTYTNIYTVSRQYQFSSCPGLIGVFVRGPWQRNLLFAVIVRFLRDLLRRRPLLGRRRSTLENLIRAKRVSN